MVSLAWNLAPGTVKIGFVRRGRICPVASGKKFFGHHMSVGAARETPGRVRDGDLIAFDCRKRTLDIRWGGGGGGGGEKRPKRSRRKKGDICQSS